MRGRKTSPSVADIRDLLVHLEGPDRAAAARIDTRRIDRPDQLGNLGVFRHDITGADGTVRQVVEKRTTSEREWFFFRALYPLLRARDPTLTPELLGVGPWDGTARALYLACGRIPRRDHSDAAARRIGRLIGAVAALPGEGLASQPTRVPGVERIAALDRLCRELPDAPIPDPDLLRRLETGRAALRAAIAPLPLRTCHSDVKWANMVLAEVDGARVLQLIDWGQIAQRTEGFDLHEFLTFAPDGTRTEPGFAEAVAAHYHAATPGAAAPAALMPVAFTARANWALGHFLRLHDPRLAATCLAALGQALDLVQG